MKVLLTAILPIAALLIWLVVIRIEIWLFQRRKKEKEKQVQIEEEAREKMTAFWQSGGANRTLMMDRTDLRSRKDFLSRQGRKDSRN